MTKKATLRRALQTAEQDSAVLECLQHSLRDEALERCAISPYYRCKICGRGDNWRDGIQHAPACPLNYLYPLKAPLSDLIRAAAAAGGTPSMRQP